MSDICCRSKRKWVGVGEVGGDGDSVGGEWVSKGADWEGRITSI